MLTTLVGGAEGSDAGLVTRATLFHNLRHAVYVSQGERPPP